jgi:hypothetical protein
MYCLHDLQQFEVWCSLTLLFYSHISDINLQQFEVMYKPGDHISQHISVTTAIFFHVNATSA